MFKYAIFSAVCKVNTGENPEFSEFLKEIFQNIFNEIGRAHV